MTKAAVASGFRFMCMPSFLFVELSPHYRFDRWTGEMQTMTPGGKWVQEKLTDKKI
jgi:hypothetical protein